MIMIAGLRSRSDSVRHRRSKHGLESNCPEIQDDHLQVELVRAGRTSESLDITAKGAVLKVNCSPGYELNIPKKKVRCKRGEWRPSRPVCHPLSCQLPRPSEGGTWKLSDTILPSQGVIGHGKKVEKAISTLSHFHGYFPKTLIIRIIYVNDEIVRWGQILCLHVLYNFNPVYHRLNQ